MVCPSQAGNLLNDHNHFWNFVSVFWTLNPNSSLKPTWILKMFFVNRKFDLYPDLSLGSPVTSILYIDVLLSSHFHIWLPLVCVCFSGVLVLMWFILDLCCHICSQPPLPGVYDHCDGRLMPSTIRSPGWETMRDTWMYLKFWSDPVTCLLVFPFLKGKYFKRWIFLFYFIIFFT